MRWGYIRFIVCHSITVYGVYIVLGTYYVQSAATYKVATAIAAAVASAFITKLIKNMSRTRAFLRVRCAHF